ncbi:hypothetical protein [Yersinia intermedia]|uniref:hypothetical protein n=1 Tax=Yersinia intermedia TaxID=631 RepID=UPI0005E7A32A|nr:hypothetical protein [Yersinia intermedia]CND48089.1 Uncharacterised protein [Yersinia intermedia]
MKTLVNFILFLIGGSAYASCDVPMNLDGHYIVIQVTAPYFPNNQITGTEDILHPSLRENSMIKKVDVLTDNGCQVLGKNRHIRENGLAEAFSTRSAEEKKRRIIQTGFLITA